MNLQPKDIDVSLIPADHEQNLGQWSTQTYSGIVLYHKPTGIQVKCTKHKSQWKNKSEAMLMLDEKVNNTECKLTKIKQIVDSVSFSDCECSETASILAMHTLLQIKVLLDD